LSGQVRFRPGREGRRLFMPHRNPIVNLSAAEWNR
jgi:hypothetical protein